MVHELASVVRVMWWTFGSDSRGKGGETNGMVRVARWSRHSYITEWSVLRGLGLRDTGLAGEPWRKSHGDEQEGDTNRNKKPL